MLILQQGSLRWLGLLLILKIKLGLGKMRLLLERALRKLLNGVTTGVVTGVARISNEVLGGSKEEDEPSPDP